MIARFRALSLAVLTGLLLFPLAYAETVMLEMRDGTKLATDFHLPSQGGPEFPVIVARSVYGRGGPVANPIVKGFNDRGYAFVIQDTRGRFDSEGKDMAFADDGWGERQDGADTIAWVAKQPWCNGKIGTWGGSALGITQVMMASATQDVTCQSISVASSNFYGQVSYQGGVFRKNLCEGWLKAQDSLHVVEVWHSHPFYDDFWKLHNAEDRAPKVTAPALHVGGWWDIFGQGTINNFTSRQYNGGEGAKGNQKLIMGAWIHGPAPKPGDLVLRDNFAFDLGAYDKRFADYWLKGDDNGVMDEPAVNYYTIGDVDDPDAPGNEWRTADDWPPFPTTETPYYLGEGGALTTEPPTAEEVKVTCAYNPADPCPTHGGANLLLPAGPFDQRKVSNRPDVVKFVTEPLEKPVEITGHVKVRLFVSSDAPDTDFAAKLIDMYPDGREILMLDNIQRLKYRQGFEKPEPLEPNTVGELTIDLWSISLIFNKGHRIGLQISGSNYPRFEKNPNTGEDFPGDELRVAHNSVYMDKGHPSALVLPVRRAEAAVSKQPLVNFAFPRRGTT